jgi:soluble lytic murein transglycosylase-like protein
VRLALFILGLLGCTIATCGPARAATPSERALSVLCPRGDVSAPLVEAEAHRQLIHPALLVALVAHESRCRSSARSGRGDWGLAQIRVGGSAAHGATAAELLDPAINLRLAAAHLARVLTLCGGFSGLSVYSGFPRCRSTRYSRAVLALFLSTFGGK